MAPESYGFWPPVPVGLVPAGTPPAGPAAPPAGAAARRPSGGQGRAGKLRLARLPVLWLLTLLLRRPGLLCVVLAARQGGARQGGSRPVAVAARLARLSAAALALAVTRACLAPAGLRLVPAVASRPVASRPSVDPDRLAPDSALPSPG